MWQEWWAIEVQRFQFLGRHWVFFTFFVLVFIGLGALAAKMEDWL